MNEIAYYRKEMDILEPLYKKFLKGESFLIGMKGVRRVGKSFSVNHFIKMKMTDPYKFVYLKFIGQSEATSQKNIDYCYDDLIQQLKDLLNKKELNQIDFTKPRNWKSFFNLLKKSCEVLEKRYEKFFIFFDEMSFYSKKREFIEAFTHYWNYNFVDKKDYMIFIASSNLAWIDKNFFKNTKSFFQRATTIELKPFSVLDVIKYNLLRKSSLPIEDIVNYYMMFGGILKYYNLIDPDLTFEENLKQIKKYKNFYIEEYNILFNGMFNSEDKRELYRKCFDVLAKEKNVTVDELVNRLIKNENRKTFENKIGEILNLFENNRLAIKTKDGKLNRYSLCSAYGFFCYYWKTFSKIDNQDQFFSTWKGSAFEIMILNNLELLGFSAENAQLNYTFKIEQETKQVDIITDQKMIECKNYGKTSFLTENELNKLVSKAEYLNMPAYLISYNGLSKPKIFLESGVKEINLIENLKQQIMN